MLLKILATLAIIVVAFVIVVALQPAEFNITRTATIKASPADIFAQVNDFHKWEAWSPWAKLDPNATTTFGGAPAGVGAVMKWSGNNAVGEGSSTIVESTPNESIKMRLDFVRPFTATNSAEFRFKSIGDQTEVAWSMAGHNNFFSKAVGLIMNCEKMVGEQFEKGLAQIRTVVESQSK